MVVADLTKDWRFKKNPKLAGSNLRVSLTIRNESYAHTQSQFYASAPLRYQNKDSAIDLGTLCLFSTVARDTFDAREQGILRNLANMLVYQLMTLVCTVEFALNQLTGNSNPRTCISDLAQCMSQALAFFDER
jgi:hypothetical protein